MPEAKPGTPIAELPPRDLREHVGRVVAGHHEAARAVGIVATKAAVAGKPEHIEDVLRGATGVAEAETEEGS